MWKNPETRRDFLNVPQRIYILMGFFDSASSTLGAFAGVYCPGELQTILNQVSYCLLISMVQFLTSCI